MGNSINKSKRQLISWAFYDWANGAYACIIGTFVYAAYFVNSVAPNKTEGMSLWGMAIGISGLCIAFGSPVLGAIADQGGNRKRWLALFTSICITSIASMYFVQPKPQYVALGLILIGFAATASDYSYVFYNAMLPELASREKIGRWSGWGWSLGYFGGVLSLLLCLLFIRNKQTLWGSLDDSSEQAIRICFVFVSLWYLTFALPLFLFTPRDKAKLPMTPLQLISKSFGQLKQSFIEVHSHFDIYRFLIARMIYTDALVTLFAFGGVYAAAAFSLNIQEVILFGILLNISGGIGACSFAFLDDKFGGKTIIITSLCCLLFTGSMTLMAQTKTQFWYWGITIGLFVGPAQASSRSYLARMTPKELIHQMFGFFALSSKATAFLGPFSVSGIAYLTGSLKAGMSCILILLLAGLLLMLNVKNDKP